MPFRKSPAMAHVNEGYFMIVAVAPINNAARGNFPDSPNIVLARLRGRTDLLPQPAKVSCATGQQWHGNNLRNRIAVQLAHTLFERREKLFARLDNQQFFIALFDLTLPAVGRLDGTNTVHAGCELLANQGLGKVLSLRRRPGSDIYNDKIQHQ